MSLDSQIYDPELKSSIESVKDQVSLSTFVCFRNDFMEERREREGGRDGEKERERLRQTDRQTDSALF